MDLVLIKKSKRHVLGKDPGEIQEGKCDEEVEEPISHGRDGERIASHPHWVYLRVYCPC